MTTYNWAISQTDYLVADGFITTAHWTATATDGTYSASAYSTCSFAAATPSIPYASVTEAEVLSWVWNNGVSKGPFFPVFRTTSVFHPSTSSHISCISFPRTFFSTFCLSGTY